MNQVQQKRTILIVEDLEIDRTILTDFLKNDYELLMAKDGREALDVLREKADILSAVLLDIVMPVMDGLECCRHIKNEVTTSHIPVLKLGLTKSSSANNNKVKNNNTNMINKLKQKYKI